MSEKGKKTPTPPKSDASRFSGIEGFKRLKEDPPTSETLSAARDHLTKLIWAGGGGTSAKEKADEKAHFLFSIERSTEHLPGYATLDYRHIMDIRKFTRSIAEYSADKTRSQPLNWVLIASPGEGKSHFIECVAQKLEGVVEAVLFNMASMRHSDDLSSALDRARNVAIEGKVPLLFLDEFDCDEKNYSLLLPLLWDGKIELGERRLKIGRVVIVLAGSDPKLPDALDKASSMKDEEVLTSSQNRKLVDLFSRINGGVLKIPSFREVDHRNDRDRRIDKVCVAIALLRRMSRKYGEELRSVPACLLDFIYHMTFRYSGRSIQHLVELIRNSRGDHSEGVKKVVDGNGRLDIQALEIIFKGADKIETEGLVYHLIHADRAAGIKETWETSKRHTHDVPVWCKAFQAFGAPTSWKQHAAGSFAMQMFRELEGTLTDGEFVDVTSFAGIEPLHITQLWLSPDDGEWNHGNKDMRHVFFNLSTLQELLSEVIAHSQPPEEVGRRMGNRFGSDFMIFLEHLGTEYESIKGIIDDWCRFDISGGWGKWQHGSSEDTNISELHVGELHVGNNFLAVVPKGMKKNGRSPFCPIMQGYIQGVLEKIAEAVYKDKCVVIMVKEVECGCEDPKKKPCRFEYSIQESPTSQPRTP